MARYILKVFLRRLADRFAVWYQKKSESIINPKGLAWGGRRPTNLTWEHCESSWLGGWGKSPETNFGQDKFKEPVGHPNYNFN